jgi:FAD/FMN-containing dehydrogenase
VNGLHRLREALDGDLVEPGSPGYDLARVPALAAYREIRPRAVVRCASTQDVARTLAYANDTGVHVVPRSGGHCFAGRSTTEGVVLDVGRLDTVTVAPDGKATVGAGTRLARVYDVLHEFGRAVPAGCGPTVGIGGLTLGGGLGLLGRSHGLTCDRLLGATVVLADGRIVECDRDREPELFWALRGAGGGQFGVVTSFVFATVAEPYATRFELRWPEAEAAAVVAAWQDWAPNAPDDVTANLTMAAEPGVPLRVAVYGCALRAAEATRTVLNDLVASTCAQPAVELRDGLSYRDLKQSFAELDPHDDSESATTSRSEFFRRLLPAAAIDALLAGLLADIRATGGRELNFTAMGGAYNRMSETATAFAHRDERFLLEHVASGPDGDAGHWVDQSWGIAHSHGSGRVYPNFPDPRLDCWAPAYHGGNHARLVAAKRTYDPGHLFRFYQSL